VAIAGSGSFTARALNAASDPAPGLVMVRMDSTGGGNCTIADDQPGLRSVYLIHIAGTAGITGVRFRLEASPGLTWTYVSEAYYTPPLEGDTQSGIAFCYGECVPDHELLAKVTYMTYGTSDECVDLHVAPFPGSNTIDQLDCDGTADHAGTWTLFINDQWCPQEPQCPYFFYGPPAAPFDFCQPVGANPSTWGAIKSMYR